MNSGAGAALGAGRPRALGSEGAGHGREEGAEGRPGAGTAQARKHRRSLGKAGGDAATIRGDEGRRLRAPALRTQVFGFHPKQARSSRFH